MDFLYIRSTATITEENILQSESLRSSNPI